MTLDHMDGNFRNVFDANPDPIVISRVADGRIVLVNGEFERASGYSKDEALGRTSTELNLWPDPKERERCARILLAGGELRNVDMTLQMKDGSRRPYLLSASAVWFNDEPCNMTVARDVTELRRIETELTTAREALASKVTTLEQTQGKLQQTEAELRGTLSANPETLVIYRRSDLTVRGVFGRSVPGLADSGIREGEPPTAEFCRANTAFIAGLRSVAESGVSLDAVFEYKANTKSETVAFLTHLAAIEFGGEPCIISCARDISEQKLIQRRLEESEAMVRKIIETSPDCITIARTSDGTYREVNEAFLRQFGFERSEVIGKSVLDLQIWDDRSQAREVMRRLRADSVVKDFEISLRHKDGVVAPNLVSAVQTELGSEQCVISIVHDITEIKQTERELVMAREAALAASQAKSEFLSSMSHEIRTPMNAIVGMTELIGQSGLTVEQRRYLDIVKTNCDSLLSLINDILDLAKIESGRMTLDSIAFDVEELADKVVEMMAVRAHEKGVEVAVRVAPGVPRNVIGDALRLRQILVNLVGNAIKFTETGYVSLEVTGAERVDDASEASPGKGTQVRLRLSVTDTGIGIPREKFGSIFSSFEQADSSTTRQYGGSGLGLAIVKRLVELYGGEISVQSEVGVGSCFSFTIVCALADLASRTSLTQMPSLRGARVLMVGETRINRLIVRELLAPLGAEVEEAKRYEEAVALAGGTRDSARPYRLLIVDCGRNGVNGVTAIAELRRLCEMDHQPLPAVLMFSSDDPPSKLARMRNMKMSAYLVKPIRRRDLMDAIRRALGEVETSSPRLEIQHSETPGKLPPMRVLLADDSPVNRLLIREYLAATPLVLDEAENGQIAHEKFKSGRYDLVIMDMRMPVMDGYATTRAIREWERLNDSSRTPIIALTASALKTDVDRCLQAGCDRHLSKPIKLQELLGAIAVAVALNPGSLTDSKEIVNFNALNSD